MEISTYLITGQGKAIPDDMLLVRPMKEGYTFAGLADGQSRKQYCREGAMAALAAAADYLETQDLSALRQRFSDELQYELIRCIRKALTALADQYHETLTAFASTLVCAIIHDDGGEFTLIHLGDGCVIRSDGDSRSSVVSPAENGITRSHTCLTTSENAMQHIRISYGQLRPGESLFLVSDGALALSSGLKVTRNAREAFTEQRFDHLKNLLRASDPDDDATLIMCKL